MTFWKPPRPTCGDPSASQRREVDPRVNYNSSSGARSPQGPPGDGYQKLVKSAMNNWVNLICGYYNLWLL